MPLYLLRQVLYLMMMMMMMKMMQVTILLWMDICLRIDVILVVEDDVLIT